MCKYTCIPDEGDEASLWADKAAARDSGEPSDASRFPPIDDALDDCSYEIRLLSF